MKELAHGENNFMMANGMEIIIIAIGPYWAAPLHPSESQCSQISAFRSPIVHLIFASSLLPAHFREIAPVAKDFIIKIRNETETMKLGKNKKI